MSTPPYRFYSETLALVRTLVPHRTARWAAMAALWTAVGVMSASHWSLFPMGSYPYSWWELFRIKIVLWYLWGAITPVILFLAYRLPVEWPLKWNRILGLVFASVIVTMSYLVLYTDLLILNISGQVFGPEYPEMFKFVISRHSTFYFLAFWALVGLEHAVAFYRRSHERALHASQLEMMLAKAQLSALRSRLQPHFLFNSLHSVVALIRSKRAEEATAMLTGLSELLRRALIHMDRNEVTLEEELQLLGKYIAIEKMRFSDRLSVIEEIGAGTRHALVPSFILQPLVENAIRHGVEKQVGRGEIVIRSAREGEKHIRLDVLDNGPGPESERVESANGFGLEATRERLRRMYQLDCELELRARPEGGTATTVLFPFTIDREGR